MAYTLVGHYNLGLVCLSLGIAILASYTTINLGGHILATSGWRRYPWILVGALAMGTGIWATHFVAMLALEMPIPVSYDLVTTGLSLLYAIASATVALALVSRPELSWWRLAAGGVAMGGAIASMHYTGMEAMHMPAHLKYHWPLVALSIGIAIALSTAAMELARWARRSSPPWATSLSVCLLGLSIGGLHYSGMAGTIFLSQQNSAMPIDTMPDLDGRWLALAVALGASVILVITLIMLRLNQRLTEKRLQEEALAKSEQRFRTLIREMGVGVLMLNAQAEILISNQAARQFLHLPDLGEGTPVFGQHGVICQENGTPLPPSELPVQRAIAQKASLDDLVIGIRAQAGTTETEPLRWLLVNVDPQLNKAGDVERVVCTCSDITIQKQAEEAVRVVANREKAVMQIVQRMRQTLDLEAIFAATTQELQQAVGCDRVWIYRFNADWGGQVVAEALTDSQALSTLTASTEQPLMNQEDCGARQMQNSSFDDGYRLVEDTYLKETQAETYRQDRTYHWVNDIYAEGFDDCYLKFLEQWQVRAYVIVPIFAGSKLWGLLGIYAHHQPRIWNRHEVKMVLQVGAHLGTAVQQANLLSQTQQQAQDLATAKLAADAASQAKGDFLASMSHELRTPLNAILGFTQILYQDRSLESDHRDLIAIVNRSGNHLLGLINNVLSLAKVEANKITLNETSFDLHQTLQAVNDMLQLKAEARGIQLQMVQPPPLPHQLKADEGKLRQILINLVGNAIKFTPQGSVMVRWALTPISAEDEELAAVGRHRLEIAVQDTGVGMAYEELVRLFQPFEQTRSGRHSAEGTGLGLSLSYNFAQLMGGTITVTSTVGEGSTFIVSVPVTLDPTAAITSPVQQTIAALAPGQPSHRILVADDVAESRLLMRYWLEGVGFEVREASNGQEAVETWENWHPHLICLDMRMPVLDGYGAARQIRQTDGGETPVIVAVTASVFEEQQSDCIAAGCNAVLPKPLQRETMLEYIGHSLGLAYHYYPDSSGDLTISGERLERQDHRSLTQTDLQALAPDWLAAMHRAAQAADDRRLRQLIADLPPEHHPLAQRLSHLVNNFRLDIIIDLTAMSSLSASL